MDGPGPGPEFHLRAAGGALRGPEVEVRLRQPVPEAAAEPERGPEVVAGEPEDAGHPRAAAVDVLDLELGDRPQELEAGHAEVQGPEVAGQVVADPLADRQLRPSAAAPGRGGRGGTRRRPSCSRPRARRRGRRSVGGSRGGSSAPRSAPSRRPYTPPGRHRRGPGGSPGRSRGPGRRRPAQARHPAAALSPRDINIARRNAGGPPRPTRRGPGRSDWRRCRGSRRPGGRGDRGRGTVRPTFSARRTNGSAPGPGQDPVPRQPGRAARSASGATAAEQAGCRPRETAGERGTRSSIRLKNHSHGLRPCWSA